MSKKVKLIKGEAFEVSGLDPDKSYVLVFRKDDLEEYELAQLSKLLAGGSIAVLIEGDPRLVKFMEKDN